MKIGFISALQITFIVLKLTKTIDWSWFWVLSPFVLGFIFWFLFVLLTVLLAENSKDNDKPVINKQSKFQERLEQMKKQREQNS